MDETVSIGLELKQITDKTRQVGDAAFARFGLTGPQVAYLNCVHKSGDTMPQKQIEKTFGVSHPTIVGITSRLKEKGFVEVSVDEADRRNRIITLTDQALEVTSELRRGEKQMDEAMVSGMSEEEKKELYRLLRIMNENLSRKVSRKKEA